jgi:hypothetical protein
MSTLSHSPAALGSFAHSLVVGAVALAAILVTLGVETRARADYDGYVCNVSRHPFESNVPAGSLTFDIYSGPGCTGTLVHYFSLQSATTSSGFSYTGNDLDQMYAGLMRAVAEDVRVTATMYAGIFNAYLYYLTYHAN